MISSLVWIEASVVSVLFVVLFHIIRTALVFNNPYIQVIVTGFVGHLLFEVVTLNKYYCKHGHACGNANY
jgi:hypothetical protein